MIIKHIKTIRVIIGACGVHQPAYGDKTSLRHVALSEYHLPCVGLGLIRVVIKVTDHAVHFSDWLMFPAMSRL